MGIDCQKHIYMQSFYNFHKFSKRATVSVKVHGSESVALITCHWCLDSVSENVPFLEVE